MDGDLTVSEWLTWFIALLQTAVQWLGSMQLLGVPVLFIIGASFFMGVLVRSILIKP